jgi:hypothetical protein
LMSPSVAGTSSKTTGTPTEAASAAIPAPMVPAPTIPIRRMRIYFPYSAVVVSCCTVAR